MAVNTPNMGLYQPTINVDTGLTWETDVNANSTILDNHNHTPGNGVLVPPTGISFISNWNFNDFSLTNVKSLILSPLTSDATPFSVYSIGADLYFTDGNSNVVRITSGGSLVGSVSSVSVVSANGFAGTVANPTTTAAITISTSITGILSGNGTAVSAAATTGSGSVVLATSPTLTTPSFVATNVTGLPLTTGVTGILPIANGGTNASTAAGARTNLGLAPTIQKFTSAGSGTYTTPTSPAPLYIRVVMIGGGGGGDRGGTSGGSPTAGGNTTFGTSLLVANGGGGASGTVSGTGGTFSLGSGPIGFGVAGGAGCPGFGSSSGTGTWAGGNGGSSALGGAGYGGAEATGGGASTNSGSGGGGGGTTQTANHFSGGGGGSGSYIDAIISAPTTSYSLNVGSSGTGATGGDFSGGSGAAGQIIVFEYYI